MKRLILLAAMAVMNTMGVSTAFAQEYIDQNTTITKNISFVIINGKSYPVDVATNRAILTIWNFGDKGNSAVLTLDLPEVRKSMGGESMEYTWSGKNLHVIKKKEQGCDVYAISRVSRNPIPCAFLMEVQKDNSKVWVVMIPTQDDNTRCVSDVHAGMTRLAVESKCKELGLSNFKFVRNDNKLKVYELQWIDMKKKQHWFGREDYHYELTNDKTYGSFWFDANDKLVKWLMP